MILRMRCGLVMKMHMFQGMVLTMLLRINITLGNAVVKLNRVRVYLDSDFNRTSEEGDCMFRNELFECDKIGTL